MSDAHNADLIREYISRDSESAFAELVQRHINLVYSVALRYVGHSEDARDVTQTVFIILAQKATSLRQSTILTGWLYETTRFTAMKLLRTKARQYAREQEAYMQSTLTDSDTHSVWRQLAPLLEEAMTRLSEKDRTLLALRFFENKSGAETAAILGIQEWAAHKRVNRAVEKLRMFFAKRGVVLPAAALTAAISANAVQAAPAGLAVTISTAAALGGTAIASTATATAVKTIAMTTLQKAVITASILASVTTPLLIHSQARARVREQEQTLKGQAEQLTGLRAENEGFSNRLAQLESSQPLPGNEFNALLKLRGQVGLLRNEIQTLAQPKAAAPRSRKEMLAAMVNLHSEQVRQLKRLFETNPSANIPELKLLTDDDWLNSSPGSLDTEEDVRSAMSNLRALVEMRFATDTLKPAMQQYATDHNQQSPTSLSQLKPYYTSPVDETSLARWAIVPASSLAKDLQTGEAWLLTQKAPVDKDMDQRLVYGLKTFRLGNRRANQW
jgi:RNA polymerase sigma factor (sigma-70 family)